MVASSTAVILSLAHASEVFPGSMIGEKLYFGLNQFLGGTSTEVILSVICSFSLRLLLAPTTAVFPVLAPKSAVFPGSMIGKQCFGGAIAGLEAELNGSDPICGALCLSSQPTCY